MNGLNVKISERMHVKIWMRLKPNSSANFFTRQEGKEINGYQLEDLLNLQSVLIRWMDTILNKLIFMSVMKAFHISNTFNQ